MGHHNIWIRKEDEAKWASIKDKPNWLHINLQNTTEVDAKWVGPDSVMNYGPDLQAPDVKYDPPGEVRFDTEIQLCDHDNVPGKCEYGCK